MVMIQLLTISDKYSVREVLNLYQNASGANINAQKSEIMCTAGSSCLSNDVIEIYVTSVRKILGTYLGRNKNRMVNFELKG